MGAIVERGDLNGAEPLKAAAAIREQLARERGVTIRFLRLVSSANDLHSLMQETTLLLCEWSGCDAVGIRLRDGDDFPYFETRGFPREFVEAENALCARGAQGEVLRDSQGNAILECMCGNVLRGRFDPTLPFFTANGSFWTNSTTELLASTTEADRQTHTRNRCNTAGYESVALLPLRSGETTLGLLQFNDRRARRFSRDLIVWLEGLASALAEAIARRLAEKELHRSHEQLQKETRRLRENEQQLLGLLDAEEQPVMLIDRDGIVLKCNDALPSRLGLQRQDLVGHSCFAYLPAAVARLRREKMEEAASSRAPVSFLDERGGRRLANRIVPIVDDQGDVQRFAVHSDDITVQSRWAEQLQRSKELLQAIREVQSLFIADADAEAVFQGLLKILVDNTESEYGFLDEVLFHEDGTPFKRNLAMTNIAWDDASRRLYEQLVSADFSFLNLDNLAGVPVLSGQIVIANNPADDSRSRGVPPGHPPVNCFFGIPLRSGGELVGVAGVANRRGGYSRELADFLSPLTATCAGLIAAFRAKRNLEQAQETLRRSENHFKLLYEQAPLGYQSLDVEGRLLEVNPAWLNLLGYSRDEVLGRPFTDFLAPHERSVFEQQFPRFRELGEPRAAEVQMVRKDGIALVVRIDQRVARDPHGQFLWTHSILHDITSQKQSESLLTIERDLATALAGAQQVGDVLRRAVEAAIEASGFNGGGAYLVQGESGEFWLQCHVGLSPEFVREVAAFGPDSPEARLVNSGHVTTIRDEALSVATATARKREGLQTVLVVPVFEGSCVIGCLNLGSRLPNSITPYVHRAVEAIAAQLAIALARMRSDASLRQRQAELAAIYENSPVMMCVLDDQRCPLYLNRAMADFIGEPGNEPGKRACEILGCINALDDPRGCGYGPRCESCAIRQALQDTLATGRSHRGIEQAMTLRRSNGLREVVLRAATAAIQIGTSINLLLCLEDFTERKQADKALQESEQRFRQLVEGSSDIFYRLDVRTGRLEYMSPKVFDVLGYTLEESMQMGPEEQRALIHPDDLDALTELNRQIIESHERGQLYFQKEFRLRNKAGEYRWVHGNYCLIRDRDGSPLLVVANIRDITQDRIAQDRLAEMQVQLHHKSRLALLGELTAGIAHEVNQPLCAIVNFAKACKNLASSHPANLSQIRQWSDAIASTAADVGDIIHRLTGFAKRSEHERKGVRVRELLDSAIQLVQYELRKKRVMIGLDLPEADLSVEVQPVEIRQVLLNLLRNSIDAFGDVPAAERRIVVAARRQGEWVEVTVSDNGIGLSEAEQARIFEPFFTTKSQGLGLGLSISKTIIEDHGGRIGISPGENGGLTVRLTLPAQKEPS